MAGKRKLSEDEVRAIVDSALADCLKHETRRSEWSRAAIAAANDMAYRVKVRAARATQPLTPTNEEPNSER